VSAPRDEYQGRLSASRARLAAHERTHVVYGNVRLALFAAAAALAILALRGAVSAWSLAGPAAAFALLIVLHARVLSRIDQERRVGGYYQQGIDRIDDRWASGSARDGRQFESGHPYARDLDLFGPGSLFQRLNTARTAAGDRALAEWLSAGAAIDEVRARQQSVAELRAMIDFREQLAAASDAARLVDSDRLLEWAAQPPHVSTPAAIVFAACACVTAALAAAAYEAWLPWSILVAWLLLEAAVIYAWRRWLHGTAHGLDLVERDLAELAGVLDRIESAPFESPWLRARQAALGAEGVAAAPAIARLRRLTSLLDSTTHNLLFAPITQALLVPPQIVLAIGRWHQAHAPHLAKWLRIAGELEAAASLGAYAFERPGDPFPELAGAGACFEARALGHPLLADTVSVRNDVALGGAAPHVLVVSGSNMSGKSTLLRAIGLNIVLALAGAPVRASALRLSPMRIGATLRVDDSLQERRSRFYAEIVKIRDIVALARSEPPVIFLFDEILHGTNSHDRRVGAEAIVRALVQRGAIGLITTHDLALAGIVATLGNRAANVHFEDRLEDGRMVFDYRMRAGVVEHSNALALMRAVGLDL
jgi:hypothetical protein